MSADSFDPNRLRWSPTNGAALEDRKPTRPPRHRPREPFIKGPIPWKWLERAGQLPGRALLVGLVLWREAGCRNAREVRVNLSAMGIGLSRKSAGRGLVALESAKLVRVDRLPGRCPIVELLDVEQP
jgi:hypothetical protein